MKENQKATYYGNIKNKEIYTKYGISNIYGNYKHKNKYILPDKRHIDKLL
jgi:hypothetical protein